MEQEQSPSGTPLAKDSLAPIQTHRLSVEAEASLMNRGRGRQLAGLAVIAVALGILAVVTLRNLARTEAYSNAAAAAADAEKENFEGFFTCALPGASPAQLTTSTRVHTAFERVADRLGKRYGATLRGCAPRLDELSAKIAGLDVPGPLAAKHAALQDAVKQLQGAEARYQAYLDDHSSPYQYVTATPLIERLALAYQAYREAHAELSRSLREGL